MNMKRILACALAMALALSLWTVPAAAASFSDVDGHWAESYIDDMTDQGLFNGYEDGTFRPNNELTVAEGLALCARSLFIDETITDEITAQRSDEVEAILGTSLSWFHGDFAVCLEMGVVSNSELSALVQSGDLTESITKESFSRYLVRAMGLETLALSLQSYSMSFADADDIGDTYVPYVYVLNTYGIVEGTEENKFEPQSLVNRATSATMLSRIVEFVDEQGISIEVANYTEYDWVAGVVTSVTSGTSTYTVTLESYGETFDLAVSTGASVYQNNMPMSVSNIKINMYARMALDDDGDVTEVRLVAATSMGEYSGTLSSVSDESVTMWVGSTKETYTIDRFTRVMVGVNVGDRTLIDSFGDYTTATCTVEADGTVLAITLSGGTSEKTGILNNYSYNSDGTTLVQLSNFDGSVMEYTLPSTAIVRENSATTTLKSSQIGCYVTLAVSNDSLGVIEEMYIDSSTTYIQAEVISVNYISYPNTIYVTDYRTGISTTYEVIDDSTLTYDGTSIALKNVTKGWFMTAKCDVYGDLETLEFYEGSTTIAGTITSLSYGSTTTVSVQDAYGNTYAFELSLSDLPSLIRDGATSSVDKLRVGDTVEVTVQYNVVEEICSFSQEVTVTGTIERLVQESAGTTMEVLLSDMTYESYTLLTSTTVTENDSTLTQSVLAPGMEVGLVMNDGDLLSVDILSRGDSESGEISGTVLYADSSARTITLLVTTSGVDNIVIVQCASGVRVLTKEGTTISIATLEPDDTVVIYGSYTDGEFSGTVVLRD